MNKIEVNNMDAGSSGGAKPDGLCSECSTVHKRADACGVRL